METVFIEQRNVQSEGGVVNESFYTLGTFTRPPDKRRERISLHGVNLQNVLPLEVHGKLPGVAVVRDSHKSFVFGNVGFLIDSNGRSKFVLKPPSLQM